MSFLTGPEALIDYLKANWQQSRTGRPDVPDVVRDSNGDPSSNPRDGSGVLILRNREEVAVDRGRHDLIHCYHPETTGLDVTDAGFNEQNTIETVQIDIELTDRTDHTRPAGEQRLSATERMMGERDDLTTVGEPPYPGIFGETKYLLETIRRGLDEYDRTRHNVERTQLRNSNADVALRVELEQIATNTVQ